MYAGAMSAFYNRFCHPRAFFPANVFLLHLKAEVQFLLRTFTLHTDVHFYSPVILSPALPDLIAVSIYQLAKCILELSLHMEPARCLKLSFCAPHLYLCRLTRLQGVHMTLHGELMTQKLTRK